MLAFSDNLLFNIAPVISTEGNTGISTPSQSIGMIVGIVVGLLILLVMIIILIIVFLKK